MWQETLAKLYRMLLVKPDSTILDIGTGFTTNVQLLLENTPSNARIWSVDPEQQPIDSATSRFREQIISGRLSLKRARAEELPFKDGFFDYVTTAITFHHVLDKRQALGEVGRVMKREGLGILLDWDAGGAEYSPHPPQHLEKSMNETLALLREMFKIRIEKQYSKIFYYVVFEKKG